MKQTFELFWRQTVALKKALHNRTFDATASDFRAAELQCCCYPTTRVLWDRPVPPMSDAAASPRLTPQTNQPTNPRRKKREREGEREKTHPARVKRARRLELTSGRLCWRPALRRPASMSEPRSSRPPWAPLSYYSHSSGCSRGCQTSKRTFSAATISLSLPPSLSHLLLSLTRFLSSSPRLPPSSSLPPRLHLLCGVCLIALSQGAKWRGLFRLVFSCARRSQSKQKMRHGEKG